MQKGQLVKQKDWSRADGQLRRAKHFNWHLPQNSKLSAWISSLCSLSLDSCHPAGAQTELTWPLGAVAMVLRAPREACAESESSFKVDVGCLESLWEGFEAST